MKNAVLIIAGLVVGLCAWLYINLSNKDAAKRAEQTAPARAAKLTKQQEQKSEPDEKKETQKNDEKQT